MVNSAPSSNLPAGTPAPRSPSFLSPSSSSNRTDLLQRLSHIIISRACCSSAPRGGRSSLACQRGLGGYPAAPFRHRGRTTRVARRWHVGGAAVRGAPPVRRVQCVRSFCLGQLAWGRLAGSSGGPAGLLPPPARLRVLRIFPALFRPPPVARFRCPRARIARGNGKVSCY